MQKQKVLTISILISKRPDTVRKCLDSIKPILEELDAELILTDTGCGEEVRGIIEEYTDNIIDFVWCRDFSKARNVGLKRAKGEWFLFLDDDEWFDDVTELIDFFKSGEYKKYGLATYYQRNYMDEEGRDYEDLLVGRTIKLEKDIEFIYSIHECFNRVPGDTKVLSTFVHHYGYVYKTKAEHQAHAERNISLLLVEHEKDPYNLKHILQLVQEYNSVERYEDSLELSLKGIEYDRQGKTTQRFCRNSLFVNVIDCYMHKEDFERIIEVGNRYLEKEELDDLAKAVIYFRLSPSYYEKGQYTLSLEAAQKYWTACKIQEEKPEEYVAYITNITASAFRLGYRNILVCVAVRSCLALGEYEQALVWLERLYLKGNQMIILNRMLDDLVDLLPKVEGKDYEAVLKICNTLLEKKGLEDYFIERIEWNCHKASDSERIRLLLKYHELEVDSPFFQLIDVLKLAEDGANADEITQAMTRLCKDNINLCFRSMLVYRVWEIAAEAGADISGVIQNITYSVWDKTVLSYSKKYYWEEMEKFHQWLTSIIDKDEIHYLSWSRAYLFEWLRKTALELKGGDSSTESETEALKEIKRGFDLNLVEYARCSMALTSRIYRPEILALDTGVLPEDGQAGFYLAEWKNNMAKRQYPEAISSLKEIQKRVPAWAQVVQICLKDIEKELEQQKNARDELFQLGEQLKKKAAEYIAAGQQEAARMILMQLKTILPEDKEIDNMLSQL
ncbi:MAG: glycosyltransferase [Lachnospiraceae bacterium]|nr:glycosyltransferase [Lachnospiraceae bacterium]